MKKDKILLLLSCLTTLVLGPGVGHLIIREWKKAIFLIALSLALFVILAVTFISAVGQEALQAATNFQNIEQFKNIYENFRQDNSNTMLIFNISFAALWAYSIVDLFMIAKSKGTFEKKEQ